MLSDITKEFYTKVYVSAGTDKNIYSTIGNEMLSEYENLRDNFTYDTFLNVYDMLDYGYVYNEGGWFYFSHKFIDEVINAI